MLKRLHASLQPTLGRPLTPRARSRLSTCAALAAFASLRAPLAPHSQSSLALASQRSFSSVISSYSPIQSHSRTMATAIGDIPAYDPWTSQPVRHPFVEGKDVFKNLLPGYKVVPATESTPAHAVFEQPLQRSQNDDREYR